MTKLFFESLRELSLISRNNFNFYSLKGANPRMIKKVADELSLVVMQNNIPTAKDLEEVRKDVYYHLDAYGYLDLLDRKSVRWLPLLLKDEADIYKKLKFVRKIKSENSIGILRNEILGYFMAYSNDMSIEKLAEDIVRKLSNYEGKNPYFKLHKEFDFLYKKEELKKTALFCVSKGFFNFFKMIHLNKMVFTSPYIKLVLLEMFSIDKTMFSLEKKMEFFSEIFQGYANIFFKEIPVMVSKIILDIEESNDSQKESYKERIKRSILSYFGDPRIDVNNKWKYVDAKAKSIFIKWISKYDLELFFKIIEKGLYDFDAKRMWRYRKAFWESYKDEISSVWVCFGESAIYRVSQLKKNEKDKLFFGKYKSSDSEKSCIIINIGDYTLVERSHTGSLKCYKTKESKFYIGQAELSESNVNKEFTSKTWNHNGSENYRWQSEVGEFLNIYCHINRKQEDWMPM